MSKAKKQAAKPSTALAVRPKKAKAATVTIEDPKGLMVPQTPVGQLGELATVGALGLAEIKLTDAEEAVLARPVNPADILVRDGNIAYLPHIVYTRWFNQAFGRTGWAIVPTATPKKIDKVLLVPFLLYIHGVPVAAATGEHEYSRYGFRSLNCAPASLAHRTGCSISRWSARRWAISGTAGQPISASCWRRCSPLSGSSLRAGSRFCWAWRMVCCCSCSVV